jgi:hypothetical protein
VINNLTGAMAKKFVCKACNKGCGGGWTHKCDQKCSDFMSIPPCVSTGFRIPCDDCNRHFRSQTCFDNHKQMRSNKSSFAREREFASHVVIISRTMVMNVTGVTAQHASKIGRQVTYVLLILILLTLRIWRALNNASKWHMGFNSAFQVLRKAIDQTVQTL